MTRRGLWSVALITSATALLSLDRGAGFWNSVGAVGILLACILWGIDNNLTRNVSAKDPLTIVTLKAWMRGVSAPGYHHREPLSWFEEWWPGGHVPGLPELWIKHLIFIFRAMHAVGAARTSALFGTSPIAGVALSLVLLRGCPIGSSGTRYRSWSSLPCCC